jgi:hypothetical protein
MVQAIGNMHRTFDQLAGDQLAGDPFAGDPFAGISLMRREFGVVISFRWVKNSVRKNG